jgi:hypothetical protein
MWFARHTRRAAGPVAMLGLLMAGCATQPSNVPVDLSREAGVKFNTGRVTVVVTDFGGQPLSQARVDVEGINDHKDYFRTAAFSDVWGRVSFAGVPEKVRISVYHAATRANYSREFDVPAVGTTELRMLVETYD